MDVLETAEAPLAQPQARVNHAALGIDTSPPPSEALQADTTELQAQCTELQAGTTAGKADTTELQAYITVTLQTL